MPSATGIRGTGNLGVSRKYDIADVISLLDVNRYPLLGILTNAGKDPATKQGKTMKKKETTDPEFKWFEDEYQKKVLTGSGTVDPDGGNLTITGESQYLQVGDVISASKQGWVFGVTVIVDANTVTVGAELGGATGAAADVAGDVVVLGNANEEGAGLREIKATTVTKPSNYCQIFRTPIGITETARNTKGWTKENDFDYQSKKKAIEHMIDIERAFLFGKKHEDTGGTHPKRFTGGIIPAITSYSTANVDTEAEFEAWLEAQAFAHGNLEKYFFCAGAVISMVNSWAKKKLELVRTEKTFGMRILNYESAFGLVHFIRHPLLTGTKYGNYGVMLDMETLTHRHLSSRDTKLLTNRQNPGEDSRVDEYLSEVGLQMEQEKRQAIMSIAAL